METQNDIKNVNVEEASKEVLVDDYSKDINDIENNTREVLSNVYSFEDVINSLEDA